jgi:hypothetical protein
MKKTPPTPHDVSTSTPAAAAGKPAGAPRHRFTLGLDPRKAESRNREKLKPGPALPRSPSTDQPN